MLGINSWHQCSIFICLYVGYMFYIFNRKSFSFVIPNIVETDGLNSGDVGTILSAQAVAYGIGKFVSGMLVDRFSATKLFCAGLCLCGASNILFSVSPPGYFSVLWFFNGLVQGPGWPSCAIMLKKWFSPAVFGTLWSSLSTSMNVPASLGPIACSVFIAWSSGSWRPVMLFFGGASICVSFGSLFVLKDRPEDVGLTLEMLTGEKKIAEDQKKNKESTMTKSKHSTWSRILSSPYTYVVCGGFLVSLIIKGVVCDWGSLYLIQEKQGDQFLTGAFLGTLELGGVIGSIASGYLSDVAVAKIGIKQIGQPRHFVLFVLFPLLFLSMYALRVIVTDLPSQQTFVNGLGFVLGFCMYGIISLVGVLALENSADDIAGTTHAFCALLGNVGLTLAGLPFSAVMEYLSWNGALQLCELSIIISFLLFVFAQRSSCRIGDQIKED
nr:glucose-6-phosphate exchanger SLC37A4-like [Ciona intestinalis]|eukprot:XP_002130897.1 glucose-6-phosphate exchanger SLC37A4-like [Ciona intestinalis]